MTISATGDTFAQVALRAIGGITTVELAQDFHRPRLEKNFVAVYCQCSDRDALMLQPSVTVAPIAEPVEYSAPPPEIKAKMQELTEKLKARR